MSKQASSAAELGANIDSITENLEQAQDLDEYLEQVFRIFDIYGLGHGCLHSVHHRYTPSQALWRVTPDEVTSACSHLVKTENHPAISLGKNRHFPFDLFDFRDQFKDDSDVEALYAAFEKNGVNNAYGLPIQTANRGTFVFVVARPASAIETVELLTLQAICSNAVNGVQQFAEPEHDQELPSKLSDSDRKILFSIATGESITTISKELNVSELTISLKLDHIVERLSAQNVSHAIVLLLIEGELRLDDLRPA